MTSSVHPPLALSTKNQPVSLSLNDHEMKMLAELNQYLGIRNFGEGDLATGINALTLCALTIVNLSPYGSSAYDKEEKLTISVGMNLVISGSKICSIAYERALGLIHIKQNNVCSHVRQQVYHHVKQRSKNSESGSMLSKGSPPPLLNDYYSLTECVGQISASDVWKKILAGEESNTIESFVNSHIFFTNITSPNQIQEFLRLSNGGRILIHTDLTRKSDFALLEKIQHEVIGGTACSSPLPKLCKGEVIATDPLCLLDRMILDDPDLAWMGRMLWIGDFESDPQLASVVSSPSHKKPEINLANRFRKAFNARLLERIDIAKGVPIGAFENFASNHYAWVKFLNSIESLSPGISGTLRNLYACLVFGLHFMMNDSSVGQYSSMMISHVQVIAKIIALRMIKHRDIILKTSRHKELEMIAASIKHKLAKGPQKVRELMRSHNRLDAPTCRDALERLVNTGVAEHNGTHWSLVSNKASLQPKQTTIDV